MARSLISRTDRFLFQEVSATPLAALRIGTGVLVIVWTVNWLNVARTWLGHLRLSSEGFLGWWHPWADAPYGITLAMGWLLLLVACALTVGAWTRSSAWLAFVLMVLLQRYNFGSFNSGDTILRSVLLLGVALGPSGAYLSVDAARKGWSWFAPRVSVWSLRFVQLQISLGYLLTVILKLRGERWLNGDAVWDAFHHLDLVRFQLPDWLIGSPVGVLLGWSTLVIELLVGIGVWFTRLRPFAITAGIGLHVAIAATMEIGLFSFVMLASYLAWTPAVSDIRDLVTSALRSLIGNARPTVDQVGAVAADLP
ncbi:MAG: HTTM domain-containing protein [Actinomycetota bacterium]